MCTYVFAVVALLSFSTMSFHYNAEYDGVCVLNASVCVYERIYTLVPVLTIKRISKHINCAV